MFWSAAHTQTRAPSRETHTHTYRETRTHRTHRDTHRDTHNMLDSRPSHCASNELRLRGSRLTQSAGGPSSCSISPTTLAPYNLPSQPAATKLDDFQLCSTSLPPALPHDVASESSFSFFLALLATVGNVFTLNRGHLHTHTHAHTHGTCICVVYVHIKFYYCHFP